MTSEPKTGLASWPMFFASRRLGSAGSAKTWLSRPNPRGSRNGDDPYPAAPQANDVHGGWPVLRIWTRGSPLARVNRTRRIGTSLEEERTRIAILGAAILAMYAAGVVLLVRFAPTHPGFLGAAALAYTLGLRHAFDADHIAAIDNTTRRLRHAVGRRPLGVGFFFALGHSTLVLALTAIAVLVMHGVPGFGGPTTLIGSGVSGTFLWAIGILNLFVLLDIVRVAARMRIGSYEEGDLQSMGMPRGVLMRLGLGRLLRLVSHSWQMFPVGLLFGLGFETASEIALLALGASAAVAGLPFVAVLCLPILFAAGMSTVDTIDGILMGRAYDWALRHPARKVFYNFTITSLSVIAALLVGTIELLHVTVSAFGWESGTWSWIDGLDFETLGYGMAALFLSTWVLSMTLWRVLGIEKRLALGRRRPAVIDCRS